MGVAPTQVDSAPDMYAMGIPCFTSGTRIMTPSGERLVEDLSTGATIEAGPQPLLWHGRRRLGQNILKERPELLPILIRDGTFGNRGDLLVSAQHGMVVPDPRADAGRVLARAVHLSRLGEDRVLCPIFAALKRVACLSCGPVALTARSPASTIWSGSSRPCRSTPKTPPRVSPHHTYWQRDRR